MANISLVIPSIHLSIEIDANRAANHQAECAAACLGPSSETPIIDAAVALAGVAIEAAGTEAIRPRLIASRLR